MNEVIFNCHQCFLKDTHNYHKRRSFFGGGSPGMESRLVVQVPVSQRSSGGRSVRAKVLVRRADVTDTLTALPGVAFVVGNKHRGAEAGFQATLPTEGRAHAATPYHPSRHVVAAAHTRHQIERGRRRERRRRRRRWTYFQTARRAEQCRRQYGVVAML